MIDLIDLIFKIFNFSLFIYLIIYVYKKYFKASLADSVKEEDQFLQNLTTEKENLSISQQKVDAEIVEQDDLFNKLIIKIQIWKETEKSDLQKKENQKKDIEASLENKLNIQFQNYNIENLKNELSPLVMDKLKSDLKAYYQNEKNGQNYISYILKSLSTE